MRAVALALLLAAPVASATPRTIHLWHSYHEAEEAALLRSIALFERQHPDIHVDALSNPYEGYAAKLTASIPNDNGPDVFIFAHERLGGWAKEGIVLPLDGVVPESVWSEFLPETVAPIAFASHRYGLPLAFKSAALFCNRALVPVPPATTDELIRTAERLTGGGRYGLAYQADNFYFHAAWYLGFGAEMLDREGVAHFESPGAIASFAFVADLARRGLLPSEPTGALVSRLFGEGKAAMVISGPWFIGEIDKSISFSVAPLPRVSQTGRPASPLLTDEAIFISAHSHDVSDAALFAQFLAGRESAVIRATEGRQVVANRLAWEDPRLRDDPILGAFRAQLATATPTDNRAEMEDVWEPGLLALKKVLRGEATPEQAAHAAQHRYNAIARPVPPPADPRPYVAVAVLLMLAAIALGVRWILAIARRKETPRLLLGARWAGPGLFVTVCLVFLPFAVGLILALFAHKNGAYTFIGLRNFKDILASRGFRFLEPLSFYYALLVTLAWTAINVVLHVSIGLSLALLLNRPLLKLKGIYRVLLIVPWAVPNYITALLWKGMFHRQFGAINGVLRALGLTEVSWFNSFGTAFFANVCANTWLGFPFMMVVCLGALQSVPRELYEAADVDGASAWNRFREITLPLLWPALVPAILLGIVWTFNQFNVVYLVSGGDPDNSTDILISEAYRWAFARQEQYGYAAAYAGLIFVLLLGWSVVSQRIARAVEEVR